MFGHLTLVHAMLVLISISTIGCVNLDKNKDSTVPYPQSRIPNASKAPAAIAVAAQKSTASTMNLASKLKRAVLPSKSPYQVERLAKDDPTSLANKPGPIGPDLYIAGARLAESHGQLPEAMEQYRQALRVDGRNRNAMIGLARLQHRTGDMESAIGMYRQALDVYRSDPVILNDLGLCYARAGQLEQAIAVLRSATQAAPDREMYRNNLAATLVEAGRPEEGIAHLTRTYGPAIANYNVGYLLKQSGRNEVAADYLTRALQLDPSMSSARDLLAETVPQLSSLPRTQAIPADRYEPPVGTPREPSELSLPNRQRPAGVHAPAAPSNTPGYLNQQQPRFGPFGYVPIKREPEAMLVSYDEPTLAPVPEAKPVQPPYPKLQPAFPVLLPLRLPETRMLEGKIIPPKPNQHFGNDCYPFPE